jgi:ribonuclease D
VVRRIGAETLEAIRRAEALPESELPVRQREPRPSMPAAVRRRAEALRAWRAQAAQRLGLDPGFLLPQRLIDRLAADVPPSVEALAEVDGMRRWRAALCGVEVLHALASS